MDYRKKYEEELGILLPKDYDVHHINQDRCDNSIENLVALPKPLHQRYHTVCYAVSPITLSDLPNDLTFHNCNRGISYEINILKEYDLVITECFKYIVYRDFLLNKLPISIINNERLY